eukprot:6454897-Amphidinium_carterae.2
MEAACNTPPQLAPRERGECESRGMCITLLEWELACCEEANVQLQKAEKSQKSNRATKCMIALVVPNLEEILKCVKHLHLDGHRHQRDSHTGPHHEEEVGVAGEVFLPFGHRGVFNFAMVVLLQQTKQHMCMCIYVSMYACVYADKSHMQETRQSPLPEG